MSSVIFKNIYKSYDGRRNIIDGISLDIKDKEFVVLVGSSGCGKSTLLRLISGLEELTSGDILIDNEIVNNKHPKDRDIAFVFQSYALYPHMSVYDNIAFGLKMRKFDKNLIKEKVINVAKALNLEDLLDRKPKQLSGGQRQRVALGRAIVRNPKVFLMDEPLSNLDANLRVQMRTEIKRLHKELKTTFVYVTHDQTEALTMGERIVVLDKGKVQQFDTPYEIYNNPKNQFVAGFIGQMNFFESEVKNNKILINGVEMDLPKDFGKNKLTIGMRPEKMIAGTNGVLASVDIVEMCGGEQNVYFSINNEKCFVKVPLEYNIKEGIELKINVNDMFFFDTESGERLI